MRCVRRGYGPIQITLIGEYNPNAENGGGDQGGIQAVCPYAADTW